MKIDTIFRDFEQNHLIKTKKELFVLYALSVLLTVVGLIGIFRHLGDGTEESTHTILLGVAISLCGIAIGLGVYFRRQIPARVKFYVGCLFFTIGGIWMILNPNGFHRMGPSAVRFWGYVCTIFFGGGGLLLLCNDIKRLYDHRNDVYDDSSENGLSDGLIRIDNNVEKEIENAINQFNLQHNHKGLSEFKINRYSDHSILILKNIDYSYFCSLFNYLVYRKKPTPDYSLRGWLKDWHFKTGNNVIDGPVMFFIPDSDTEYDNVYFVTTEGVCYKQALSGLQKITNVGDNGIAFELPK